MMNLIPHEYLALGLILLLILVAGFIFFFRKKPAQAAIEKEKLITLEEALHNTKKSFWGRITSALSAQQSPSQELENIEEVLYTSDLGPKTVQKLLAKIQEKADDTKIDISSLHDLLKNEMRDIFKNNSQDLGILSGADLRFQPEVWMIVGVNGAGKTTTIGKLAHQLSRQTKMGRPLKVMIAAGDTFRAAAKEQLKVWADRSHVFYFSPEGVENPSGVAFDAVKKAIEEHIDVLIIDTAGRLHTQGHLMEELKKIKRVMDKALPGAPHEVLLVLDSNSGQNALVQAREFNDALGVTGVILTKMDGTAKGGVALGVASDLNLNIKLIGIGEKVEDLRPFNSEEFINSIL